MNKIEIPFQIKCYPNLNHKHVITWEFKFFVKFYALMVIRKRFLMWFWWWGFISLGLTVFCVYKSCWNKCIILPHTLFLLSSHDNIIYNDEFTENEQNVLRQLILRSPVWRLTLFSIIDDIYGCLARGLENAIFFSKMTPHVLFCGSLNLR